MEEKAKPSLSGRLNWPCSGVLPHDEVQRPQRPRQVAGEHPEGGHGPPAAAGVLDGQEAGVFHGSGRGSRTLLSFRNAALTTPPCEGPGQLDQKGAVFNKVMHFG